MSDASDDGTAQLEALLAGFGDRLEAVEKQLALLRRDLAAQRALLESAVAAVEQIDRRFDPPDL